MQIRTISLAFADTELGVRHEAIAVFTFGDLLHRCDVYSQLQLNCSFALKGNYERLGRSLDEAEAAGFKARLGAVFVSEPEHSGEARVYVVGLGESSALSDSIGSGDYQSAVQKLFETVHTTGAGTELLTVVLPPVSLYCVERSEAARVTALWSILSLAGPFDTKYGARLDLPKRDLDLLLIVERTDEECATISAQIRSGARTANAHLEERHDMLCCGCSCRVADQDADERRSAERSAQVEEADREVELS
ncbi:MAG: hypothetical protein EKK48_26475 [Candidatus Melainabacteria bacterium]|nr:MAG: hypothetical protein EKK48_26475 [Candidatus Melainabacteria bacterium]